MEGYPTNKNTLGLGGSCGDEFGKELYSPQGVRLH